MPNYIPKAEQIDSLNEKLTAINDTLKKKNDFTDAVKNLKDVTTKAEEAIEKATTAAESVVSPTATVTKSGMTSTITITDKDGTTTAEVVDGSDATVTKDAVVGALGYEPAEKEGSYELIEIFTVDSKMTVARNVEPDGTPYKFKALRVVASYDGAGEVIQYGYFKAGTSDFAGYIGYNWYEFDVYQSQGMWMSTMHRKTTGDAEYIEQKSFGLLIPLADNPYISKFTIADANPCTINIYAIRA
jgi:hypothetical protein